MLSMDKVGLQTALQSLSIATQLSEKYRHHRSWSTFLTTSIDYDHYSELEAHAELTYAELSLLSAGVTVIVDKSFMGFVNGALYMRRCYNAYKECQKILDHRCQTSKSTKAWSTSRSINSFDSRTRLGVAMFDLLISCLPRRFVKLIEFVGFSGNRKVGLEQLTMAIDNGANDHYLPILAFISIHYFCFFEYAMGIGKNLVTTRVYDD